MGHAHQSTTGRVFPWQVGSACQADRAMGLELEVIELVRARSIAAEDGLPIESFDRQIGEVLEELAAVQADGPTAAVA